MASPTKSSQKFERLRREAEELLKHRNIDPAPKTTDLLELIHELSIYQAELEIQNEELMRAQDEITTLERQYEGLYEFAPCGYATLNPKGMITRINLTGVNLLGQTRQALLRSSLSQLIAPDHETAFFEARKAAGASGEKQSLELPLKRSIIDGPLWLRMDIEAIRNDSGHVLQWRIVFFNISKRLQIEAQRRSLARQLQQVQKMQSLGTLAGGIAHEFNNLLSIILGNISLALDTMAEQDPAVEYVAEARQGGLRAKEVVRQLLTFTHMHATPKTPLQLAPVVNAALKLIRTSLPANIEIETDIEDHLCPVVADSTQINQVIINLCSNAADAMLAGGGAIAIELKNADLREEDARPYQILLPGKYVRLTVTDSGHGMDEETRLRIFDPYFSTKETDKGTGMGLAVVHGIVENHDGAIRVESVAGQGSVFTVLFPASPALPETWQPSVIERKAGHERIMLIDDEPALVKLSKKLLERVGYRVAAFTDPYEAMQHFESAPDDFDLVLTDMAMPHMTGEQLVPRLFQIRPDIPIILCTGYSERVDTGNAEKLGVREILVKPYHLDEIYQAIRRVLEGS